MVTGNSDRTLVTLSECGNVQVPDEGAKELVGGGDHVYSSLCRSLRLLIIYHSFSRSGFMGKDKS